jgi:hypothetical protein
MKKALYEDLLNLTIGTPVVVNVNDGICDIAIFLQFNREKGTVVVCDSLINGNERYIPNICEYTTVFLFPTDKQELLHMLQKKM